MKILRIVMIASIIILALYLFRVVLNPRLDAYLLSIKSLGELPGSFEYADEGAFIIKYTFRVTNNSRMDIHGYSIYSQQMNRCARKVFNTADPCPLLLPRGGTSEFHIWYVFDNEEKYLSSRNRDFIVYSAHSHANPVYAEKRNRVISSLMGFGFARIKNI